MALAATAGSLLLWLVNPYAGLLAVPAAHLWMLACLMRPLPSRRLRLAFVGIGLLPLLLVTLYYLFALRLDPLSGAWYLLLLMTGHSVGLATSLLACLLGGAACAAAELIWRTPADLVPVPGEQGPSVYGPGQYAGPGSLGGTSSALRR